MQDSVDFGKLNRVENLFVVGGDAGERPTVPYRILAHQGIQVEGFGGGRAAGLRGKVGRGEDGTVRETPMGGDRPPSYRPFDSLEGFLEHGEGAEAHGRLRLVDLGRFSESRDNGRARPLGVEQLPIRLLRPRWEERQEGQFPAGGARPREAAVAQQSGALLGRQRTHQIAPMAGGVEQD